MLKNILLIVLGFASCNSLDATTEKFINFEVYKIESRSFPDGVLTVRAGLGNLTDIPRVVLWSDEPGQKWRLESSRLYTAFQLRPTSYESFVLEQYDNGNFLKWVASFAQFGHHKLWYLFDAGNGFTQVKNKEFDECLAATGQDQAVQTVPCTNGEDQQWKFVKL